MAENNNIILQQLQKMEVKIDKLAEELHNTNLEMTRIGGMKHALGDIKSWKENIESIVNPDDLREMKKALQEIKTANENVEKLEETLKTLKEEKAIDRAEIDGLNEFKTKAKTVIAIVAALFTTALTVIGIVISFIS